MGISSCTVALYRFTLVIYIWHWHWWCYSVGVSIRHPFISENVRHRKELTVKCRITYIYIKLLVSVWLKVELGSQMLLWQVGAKSTSVPPWSGTERRRSQEKATTIHYWIVRKSRRCWEKSKGICSSIGQYHGIYHYHTVAKLRYVSDCRCKQ